MHWRPLIKQSAISSMQIRQGYIVSFLWALLIRQTAWLARSAIYPTCVCLILHCNNKISFPLSLASIAGYITSFPYYETFVFYVFSPHNLLRDISYKQQPNKNIDRYYQGTMKRFSWFWDCVFFKHIFFIAFLLNYLYKFCKVKCKPWNIFFVKWYAVEKIN